MGMNRRDSGNGGFEEEDSKGVCVGRERTMGISRASEVVVHQNGVGEGVVF